MTDQEALKALTREALDKLDGTAKSAVALLSGLTPEQLDDLGGVPE